jgi:DHA1 family bicyclomycin/chloramphenicol resistance-like MFS transporter
MIGLSIYMVASLACATANSVEVLIVARFLQALGACVGMVAPRASARYISCGRNGKNILY